MTNKEFLKQVETFIKNQGISPSRFGLLACKDPNLVFHLRRGREVREKNKAVILTFIQNFHESSKEQK